MQYSDWIVVAGCLGALFVVKRILEKRRQNPLGLPLPPGPRGLPIVGNLFQIPHDQPWQAYDALSKEYGDILYMEVVGQGFVVLGSACRAADLLEARAAKYSSRPYVPVIDLLEMTWDFGMMPYGPSWRQHRRAFHDQLKQASVARFHPIMYEEANRLLRNLRESPGAFLKHIEQFSGTTIMRTAYGINDPKNTPEFIHNAATLVHEITEAARPGKYLVNMFPLLKYIPTWFPGAEFKRHFRKVAVIVHRTLQAPYDLAKANYSPGDQSAYPSMASSFIERNGDDSEAESVARHVCAEAYMAGSDTTTVTGKGIFLALANNPEAQRKAQAELDSVVGHGRLPLISDRPDLPYVHALVKEISRWYNVVPLGIPHCTTEDDDYSGYFIPKGTLVFPNTWAIMHDPNTFESPFEFQPERFLKDGKIDPSLPDVEHAFGYGRRRVSASILDSCINSHRPMQNLPRKTLCRRCPVHPYCIHIGHIQYQSAKG